jgi:hypothetical protein
MLVIVIIVAYSAKHKKPINTLCGKNADLLDAKPGGTYSYHRSLKLD